MSAENEFSAFNFDSCLIDDSLMLNNAHAFCSEENINQCIAFIAQEFCSLGFPSLARSSSQLKCPVDCDIITLVNITYELLLSYRNQLELKSELNDRNALLYSDLAALRSNHTQTKSALEKGERKCAGLEERIRQLTENNRKLESQLKLQKEENKRMGLTLQQQKSSFQHELKKWERQNSQMKGKIQQLVAEKNSDRRCATIDVSNILSRKNQQRGKWKTTASAQTHLEDLYSSVMTNYDIRCQKQMKELVSLRSTFKLVQDEILAVSSLLEENTGNSEKDVNQVDSECNNGVEGSLFSQLFTIKENIRSLLKLKDNKSKIDVADREILENSADLCKSESSPELHITGEHKQHNVCGISEKLSEGDLRLREEALAKQLVQLSREKAAVASEKRILMEEREALEDEKMKFLSIKVQTKAMCADGEDTTSLFFPSLPVLTTTSSMATVPSREQFSSYIEDFKGSSNETAILSQFSNFIESKEYNKTSDLPTWVSTALQEQDQS